MPQRRSDAGLSVRLQSGPFWRVVQFAAAVVPRSPVDTDRRLREVVQNEEQWTLLARLAAFDRRHHLNVHDRLLREGCRDRDILLAAALHDVGKADGRGRVRLVHRVLTVILAYLSPAWHERASRWNNGIGHGLYLAVNHAALGSMLVRDAGGSGRCCELIAQHHDDPEETTDLGLLMLIRADEGALA